MNILKWMGLIFVGLFVLIVIIQNYEAFSQTATLRVNLLFFRWQSPPLSLYLISCITFCIGVVLTGFYSIFELFKYKREIRRLKKELSEKEKELVSLRNLPVSEEESKEQEEILTQEPISTS